MNRRERNRLLLVVSSKMKYRVGNIVEHTMGSIKSIYIVDSMIPSHTKSDFHMTYVCRLLDTDASDHLLSKFHEYQYKSFEKNSYKIN